MTLFAGFPKRWRFRVWTQHACRVVRWHFRSPAALVGETFVLDQQPELCWEMGEHVVELNGPDDLQLVAVVELVGGYSTSTFMPLGFQREELAQ